MKYLVSSVFFLLVLGSLFGEANTDPRTRDPVRILLVYEESNANIDPWVERFRTALKSHPGAWDERPAKGLSSVDVSKYDLVIVYGSVMAFTTKEPLRDWLKKDPRLSGAKVGLFVTANRWFLKEYFAELTRLLKKNDATIVDAVSAATEKLKDEEKGTLVNTFVQTIGQKISG